MALFDMLTRVIALVRAGYTEGVRAHDLAGYLKMVSTHRNTRER
jgi:hypothetical protein